MLRIAIIELALLATPLVLWTVYACVTRRQRVAVVLDDAPMSWLMVAGIGLVVIGLASFAVYSADPAGEGKYVPPVYQDGRIVPGHVEPGTN